MPADTIRKQPPKKGAGKGKGKIGGISWQWWAAGLVVAIGVGLYLRNKSASTTAASPTTAATPVDTSGGVGGASGSGSGVDTTGLQDAINNLGYVLGGGGGQFATSGFVDPGLSTPAPVSGTSTPSPTAAAPSAVVTKQGATGITIPLTGAGVAPGVSLVYSPTTKRYGYSVGGTALQGPVQPQQTPPANVNPGNVVHVQVLKSGATLTTLASGRQIEQAPGKSAYVVHK